MDSTRDGQSDVERARRVAERLGLVLNPNVARTLKVATLLARNFEQHGKYYCPCKQSEPLDPVKDVVCPCPTLRDEIAKDGHCHCRLFYTEAAAANQRAD